MRVGEKIKQIDLNSFRVEGEGQEVSANQTLEVTLSTSYSPLCSQKLLNSPCDYRATDSSLSNSLERVSKEVKPWSFLSSR